jgi:hypothetical protein
MYALYYLIISAFCFYTLTIVAFSAFLCTSLYHSLPIIEFDSSSLFLLSVSAVCDLNAGTAYDPYPCAREGLEKLRTALSLSLLYRSYFFSLSGEARALERPCLRFEKICFLLSYSGEGWIETARYLAELSRFGF